MRTSFFVPMFSFGSVVSSAVVSLDETKKFAHLAQVAYCDVAQNVLDWTCTGCVESHLPVVPGSVKVVKGGVGDANQFLVARMQNRKGCVVSFRGSSNTMNWIRDLQALPTDATEWPHCAGCKVHSGFDSIWHRIKPLVTSTLHDIGCQPHSNGILYITGHSLGAALATLAAFDLSGVGFDVVKTYIFESPRVGNQQFAAAYNELFARHPSVRVTHDRDPVVHLPAKHVGYWHVDTEMFFDASGNFKVCNGEDASCADQHWNVPHDLLYSYQHCANDAFGTGFNFCNQGCGSSSDLTVLI